MAVDRILLGQSLAEGILLAGLQENGRVPQNAFDYSLLGERLLRFARLPNANFVPVESEQFGRGRELFFPDSQFAMTFYDGTWTASLNPKTDSTRFITKDENAIFTFKDQQILQITAPADFWRAQITMSGANPVLVANPNLTTTHPDLITSQDSIAPSRLEFENLFNKLTDRQAELLNLYAQGFNSAQISTKMGITDPTLRTHRREALRKLGGTMERAMALGAKYGHLIPDSQ